MYRVWGHRATAYHSCIQATRRSFGMSAGAKIARHRFLLSRGGRPVLDVRARRPPTPTPHATLDRLQRRMLAVVLRTLRRPDEELAMCLAGAELGPPETWRGRWSPR